VLTVDELIFHAQRTGSTPEKNVRKDEAWNELVGRGAKALGPLMERIHIENTLIGVFVQNIVEKIPGEESAPVLVEFLESPHASTRKAAAYFLGFHVTPQYADRLLPLLADDEAAGAAIRTLGKWRATNAYERIVPFLAHQREVRRIAAANALRDIGDPRAVPYLLESLNDQYFTVREAAARALSTMGAGAGRALRKDLMTAKDPARRHIIRTLGVMKLNDAAPLLERLVKASDETIREDALRALEQIRAGSGEQPHPPVGGGG
jgi:HEAT repeat protein